MKSLDAQFAAMCKANAGGDVAAVRTLLDAHPELEEMDEHSTWLHRAAEAGQIAVIDFWLDRGWDVNRNVHESKSDGLSTPLHDAKDAATARHLVSRGALVNAWDRYAGTPLHCAVVRALDESQRGRKRETPRSRTDQIRALVEAGADMGIADFDGKTPLGLAIELGRRAAEEALRELGAPLEGRRPARTPTKPPAIDLRKDAKRISAALAKAVKRFAREHKGTPLTALYLAVCGIEGYVMIAFDTSGASNPWDASHSEYATVEFPKWRTAYELGEKGVQITRIDGSELRRADTGGDEVFEKPFFAACVSVLEQADKGGEFEPLARATGFQLGVEATLGGDGRVWKPGKRR